MLRRASNEVERTLGDAEPKLCFGLHMRLAVYKQYNINKMAAMSENKARALRGEHFELPSAMLCAS